MKKVKRKSTKGELARAIGISRGTLWRKLKAGSTLADIRAAAKRRRVLLAQREHAVPVDLPDMVDMPAQPKGSGRVPSFAVSQAKKEAALAALRTLEYRERAGQLVNLDLVRLWYAGKVIAARDALLALPSRLRDQLAVLDGLGCQKLLDSELRQILQALADGDGPAAPAADDPTPTPRSTNDRTSIE